MECCYRPTVLDALAGTSSSYSRSTEYENSSKRRWTYFAGFLSFRTDSCFAMQQAKINLCAMRFLVDNISKDEFRLHMIQDETRRGDTYLGWEAPDLGESNWPGGLARRPSMWAAHVCFFFLRQRFFGAFLANDPKNFCTGMSQHVLRFFFL